MIVLETERLYLKMLDESSAKDVANYYKRNRSFFKKERQGCFKLNNHYHLYLSAE